MLIVLWVLVTYSTLYGAEVKLCSRKPNSEFTAGFLSAALFSWFSSYIALGQTKQLDLDDLPLQVMDVDTAREWYSTYVVGARSDSTTL